MQITQCLSYTSLQEMREGLEAFQTPRKEEEKEEDEEEKKEDDDDEKEMEGKRRDREDKTWSIV